MLLGPLMKNQVLRLLRQNFLQARYPSCRPTNNVSALKGSSYKNSESEKFNIALSAIKRSRSLLTYSTVLQLDTAEMRGAVECLEDGINGRLLWIPKHQKQSAHMTVSHI